ncbi:MAG TPA: RagB/SusD family nutrient uptake outer membrane protein [Puia sp.]|nr:RagB/SusD family nutrient uptake outer membrane protein [Puia sp.]
MKRNRKLFWGLVVMLPLLMGFFGCKKFLDRKPLTATLDDLHQGAVEGESLGLYYNLRSLAGFSLLPWLDFHSIRDDDAEKGSSQTDGAEVNTEFDSYNYTKDDWAPNTYWNDHYTMIQLANNELHDADSLKVTDEASLRNVGEAHFFRAYAYFDMVRTYGDVPILTKKIVLPSDAVKAKSPAADVYAQIDADLTIASQNLPPDWNNSSGKSTFPGRLTKGAANTLWAQSYLYRQNWSKVVALCNQVISSGEYSLSTRFVDIWKDGLNGAGKNGPESIFEMQATAGQGAATNGALDNGTDFGTSQNVRQGGATNVWNLGWGWNTPTQNLADAWDPADPRRNQTILFSGQYDGGSDQGGYGATLPPYNALEAAGGIARKFWNKKVYSDPAMRQFTGWINGSGAARWINHRILRYADVILMLAEASNELGDGATAETNLELIRNRASGNLGAARTIVPKITFTNQAAMRTAIKNERRFEFAMEGCRFYDLVRWGDALSVLGGLGYTNRARFYPIPQKAIDISGGVLKQNPEW